MVAPGSPRDDRPRFVLASIAAAVGLTFALQGVGVLPGSFMTGDPLWLVIGLVLIAAAAVYAFGPRLRRR